MAAPPGWTLDVDLPPQGPPPHEQEAYRTLYACAADGNDAALRFHPNGLCVVCLAPSHAALKDSSSGDDGASASQDAEGPEAAAAAGAAPQAAADGDSSAPPPAAAASVSAPPPQARLALSPKLLGATFRKGRGPLLMPDSILGRLSVGSGGGGAEVVLRAGVRGLLVDLNNRLGELRGAELLRELRRSYVAVLDVRPVDAAALAAKCLTEEQYQERRRRQPAERQQERPAAEQQPQEQPPPEASAAGS